MGFLDFLLGGVKPATKPEPGSSSEKAMRESARMNVRSEAPDTIREFVFNSNQHQRYERGVPVMGVQYCPRTVRVEKNTTGCPGYNIRPGDGYIVRLYNDEIRRAQMSDKPMRVIRKTPTSVELRGYILEAQSPFGWQKIDYSCYGLTVEFNSLGEVSKCVLHMFDRGVDLVYMKK